MKTVGIIGGGQLARMMALAGYPLGLRFVMIDPAADASGSQVCQAIAAAYDDPNALAQLADCCDVITFDVENVPVGAVESLARTKPFYPPPAALGASQDRLTEKTLFRQLGIATPDFQAVDSLFDLQRAAKDIGMPGILKTRRLGYDGKGQYRIKKAADLRLAWESLSKLGIELIYEAFVPFQCEVSMIGVRSTRGEVAVYPLTTNVHRQGVLQYSLAPYQRTGLRTGLRPALQAAAEKHLNTLMTHLNYTGVLTVEFFVLNGKLLANEMAPRVHNSGHWTIEGAHTSQFENHLRAICGLPLGSTRPRGYSAMVNIVGQFPTHAAVLKIPEVHLHDYGKAPRPGRKLGHITLVSPTAGARDAALSRLLRLTKFELPRSR